MPSRCSWRRTRCKLPRPRIRGRTRRSNGRSTQRWRRKGRTIRVRCSPWPRRTWCCSCRRRTEGGTRSSWHPTRSRDAVSRGSRTTQRCCTSRGRSQHPYSTRCNDLPGSSSVRRPCSSRRRRHPRRAMRGTRRNECRTSSRARRRDGTHRRRLRCTPRGCKSAVCKRTWCRSCPSSRWRSASNPARRSTRTAATQSSCRSCRRRTCLVRGMSSSRHKEATTVVGPRGAHTRSDRTPHLAP